MYVVGNGTEKDGGLSGDLISLFCVFFTDLKNPKTNKQTAGFTAEEREDFSQLLKEGFVDTFRHLYPDLTEAYTYWGYRFNCRAKNIGWCVCRGGELGEGPENGVG